MTAAPSLLPLAGLRVLDFSTLPPGAACTVMLADLGAEVIRVEPPSQKGKPSTVFGQVALGRAKRSIALDVRDPRAAAVLLRLAQTTDIVVENAKPGAMEERGFGYAQARSVNRGIVWCAITGFGQDGPYANHAGHDISFLAHSGLLASLSPEPWQPGQGLALPAGALAAVIAIQAALIARGRGGDGGFVDISLSEAAGWFLTCGINALLDAAFTVTDTPDRRCYRCADGRLVAVACSEPRTWAALCAGLDLPELADRLHQPDPTGATTQAIADRLMARPAADWVDRLAPAGAAVTLVNRGREVAQDPQVQARCSVVEIAGVTVPASPIRIETAGGVRTATSATPPGRVGDDTDAVLVAAGFAETDLAALRDAGVI